MDYNSLNYENQQNRAITGPFLPISSENLAFCREMEIWNSNPIPIFWLALHFRCSIYQNEFKNQYLQQDFCVFFKEIDRSLLLEDFLRKSKIVVLGILPQLRKIRALFSATLVPPTIFFIFSYSFLLVVFSRSHEVFIPQKFLYTTGNRSK